MLRRILSPVSPLCHLRLHSSARRRRTARAAPAAAAAASAKYEQLGQRRVVPLLQQSVRRSMAAAVPSREEELEQLPKAELVRLLLAAERQSLQPEQRQQEPLVGGPAASRGTKRTTPGDAGGQGGKRKKGKVAKKKPFDFSLHRQRHVALKVAYYGQKYHGFAAQDDSDNTIEAHLFRALQRTCLIKDRESANYSRCGRTDKGVSALGQVVGLYLRSKHTDPTNPALLSSEAVDAAGAPKTSNVVPTDSETGSGDDTNGGDAAGYTLAEAARNEVVHDPSEWATPDPGSELNYIKMLNGVLPPEIRVLGWAHVPPSSLFSARFSCQRKHDLYASCRQPRSHKRLG
eukprot:COSAG02_NODE_604_length_19688_cov_77.556231_18_plen_346_part_00